MPSAEITLAISDANSMGDKVAAFAIAQNLLWIFASLKGELGDWVNDSRWYFVGGSIFAGAIYGMIEWLLGSNASALMRTAGYGSLVLSSSHILFWMRAGGACASSALAALAFWGTSKPNR